MNTLEEFWFKYYTDVAKKGDAWLDYSNQRVQLQTLGLALEASGPVRDKHCIDIGCGRGDLSRMLATLHASTVTGVDIVPELIAQNALDYPQIHWLPGTVRDLDAAGELKSYDVAFLLEVLQYVPFAETLRLLWDRLRPGGRLVAVFPNASCPIVAKTRARFDENYAPPPLGELVAALQEAPDLEHVAYRALAFGADQRLVPYEVSPWRSAGDWDSPPNRIQVVALKRGPDTDPLATRGV